MSEVLVAPTRGRVQQLYHRWRSRWADVVADSFNRIDAGKLGVTDTGHAWVEHGDFTPASGTGFWKILARVGGIQLEASNAVQTFWAGVASPSSDARISAVMQLNDTTAWGSGLLYRSLDGISGLFYTKTGVANQYLVGTLDGTTQPATLATVLTISGGPAWNAGEWHELSVLCQGSNHTFYVDGSQIGTLSRASNGGRIHGLFHYHGVSVNPFRRFKIRRA